MALENTLNDSSYRQDLRIERVRRNGDDSPSFATIGSLRRNNVCFQCVGMDNGPVLKLVMFGFCAFNGSPELKRRVGCRLPPTCHISASTESPSRITCTSVPSGIFSPVVVKKVSKYRTNAWIFVVRSAVETNLNDVEKSSWRVVISLRNRSYIATCLSGLIEHEQLCSIP